MADNWIHDRPGQVSPPPSTRRRRTEQQPARLELPLPMPVRPSPCESTPAVESDRGVATIDFYV